MSSSDYFRDEAIELLSKIANSLHDRDPKNPNPVFFSSQEIAIVSEWLDNYSYEHYCQRINTK